MHKPGSAELVKEILLRLASRRLPANPLNFKRIHEELIGTGDHDLLETHALTQHASLQPERFLRSSAHELATAFQKHPSLVNLLGLLEWTSAAHTQHQRQKELLIDLLEHGFAPLLDGNEDLVALAKSASAHIAAGDLVDAARKARQLIEQAKGVVGGQQEMILSLRQLLLVVADGVQALTDDETSIAGQISTLMHVAQDEPLTLGLVGEAATALKTLAVFQANIRTDIFSQKLAIKRLVKEFVEQISADAASLGEKSQNMEKIATLALRSESLPELKEAMTQVVQEAKEVAARMRDAHEKLTLKEGQIESAQKRIVGLEQELAEANLRIKEDALTGALNRRGLEDAGARDIAMARRQRQPLCLAILDIDDFKILNDALGHSQGDDALKYFSSTLRTILRPADSIARFGGEEFVLLFPNTDIEAAQQVVLRAQRALTKDFWLHNQEKLLTFSSGVTLFRESDELKTMISRADRLMYAAKKSGKNRVFTDAPSAGVEAADPFADPFADPALS